MNVQFPVVNGDSAPWNILALPLGLLVAYQVILFAFLYLILTRSDFDTPNKILWVIVVAFIPLLGCVLYLIAAPAAPAAARRRVIPGSDVSGTPWAENPDYKRGP